VDSGYQGGKKKTAVGPKRDDQDGVPRPVTRFLGMSKIGLCVSLFRGLDVSGLFLAAISPRQPSGQMRPAGVGDQKDDEAKHQVCQENPDV
jgi:hypothetical protein